MGDFDKGISAFYIELLNEFQRDIMKCKKCSKEIKEEMPEMWQDWVNAETREIITNQIKKTK